MDENQRRRAIVIGGTAAAVVAGLLIAVVLVRRPARPTEAPPASQGGLIVQTGRDDDIKLDPLRPLRCFVNGQFVGELPLSACAKRNGVATGALDVGLDTNGALAASGAASSDITPLPPAPIADGATSPSDAGPLPDNAPAPPPRAMASCWQYGSGGWNRLPTDIGLGACLRTLYEGQCMRPGGALYGRWGNSTLRLLPGRVELSQDNRTFHPLVDQGPGCSLPPLG